MLRSLLSFLSGITNTVAGIFLLKSCANRQRREAEEDVRAAEEKSKAAKDNIKSAVYSNDDNKVNEIVANVLAPAILIASLVVGCSSTAPSTASIVYIPTDRRIETCTNSIGVVCKAVPNAVFAELLCAAQELKELKTEMKVDKRVGK